VPKADDITRKLFYFKSHRRQQGDYERSEKVRCIDCGYLYAWNPNASGIEGCIVDPELLRLKLEETFPFNPPPELVSGKPARFEMREVIKQGYVPVDIKDHRLQDIHEFKCYKTGERLIGYAMKCSNFEDFDELYRARECPFYFPYHVGFSAPQHLQLDIESKRARHQEEFEKTFRERQERLGSIRITMAGVLALISVASFVLSLITFLRPGTPIP